MNATELRRFWHKHFPECPPVSYLFKHNLADRWFRFHSLPESKRYAETKSETAELLNRQNTVLSEVIGDDQECVLITGNYSDSPLNESIENCQVFSEFNFQEFTKISGQDFNPTPFETDETPVYLNLLFAALKFERGFLNEVLLCIADEKIKNTFIMNCETTRIFAPYDGGADVILKDSDERDDFKLRYKDWLSAHPEGL